MYRKYSLFFALVAVAVSFASCEKDNDRCKCVDNNSGEQSIVSVDDQECGDLSTSKLSCYPSE